MHVLLKLYLTCIHCTVCWVSAILWKTFNHSRMKFVIKDSFLPYVLEVEAIIWSSVNGCCFCLVDILSSLSIEFWRSRIEFWQSFSLDCVLSSSKLLTHCGILGFRMRDSINFRSQTSRIVSWAFPIMIRILLLFQKQWTCCWISYWLILQFPPKHQPRRLMN